jgi:hypothetical protein
MAGNELGIPAFAAMNGISIIKGKAAVGANLMAAMIKSSGRYRYKCHEMSGEACRLEFFEKLDGKWESAGPSDFTISDARKAGTQNLDKFPRNMLFARAISNGIKWYCADLFIGPVYTPEELGAYTDEEGNILGADVDAEVIDQPQTDSIPSVTKPTVKPKFLGYAETVARIKTIRTSFKPEFSIQEVKATVAATPELPGMEKDELATWTQANIDLFEGKLQEIFNERLQDSPPIDVDVMEDDLPNLPDEESPMLIDSDKF